MNEEHLAVIRDFMKLRSILEANGYSLRVLSSDTHKGQPLEISDMAESVVLRASTLDEVSAFCDGVDEGYKRCRRDHPESEETTP